MDREKTALKLALEVLKYEKEKLVDWTYKEIQDDGTVNVFTYNDVINTINSMIEK